MLWQEFIRKALSPLEELKNPWIFEKTGDRRYSGNRRTSGYRRASENAGRAKSYSRRDIDEGNTDSLDPMFEILEPLTPLSTEIRRCILSPDEIAGRCQSGAPPGPPEYEKYQ